MSRTALVLLLALLALAADAARGRDDDPVPTPAAAAGPRMSPDVTEDLVEALDRGLAWLARAQNGDGSWNEAVQGTVAVTSLSVLALMAAGNTEHHGEYHEQVGAGVRYLLRRVTEPGEASPQRPSGYIWLDGDTLSRMHGHGYATLALALAYGMGDSGRRAVMRERLTRAVRVIERSQDATGGWYYWPEPHLHEGSVTVCQVQALRAAREAGIPVSRGVVERALHYLERSQDPDTGGFCYSLSDRERQTYALTAAALSTLFGLAEYGRKDMIRSGLDYLEAHTAGSLGGQSYWFHYGQLYAAQTMWQAAASEEFRPYWTSWWPRVRRHFLREQEAGGYWSYTGATDGLGMVYSTATALLTLQVPLDLLPVFER